jgi:hypothetical protein
MKTIQLSKLHAPKVPYSWQLAAGELGLFAVCVAVLIAYFIR